MKARVTSFAAILVAFFCVGCATTRERAVAIALEEVAHGKLPLPEPYTVHVGELIAAVELAPSYKLWRVDLGVSGHKEPLYSVSVDQRKGTVGGFTDYRTLSKPKSALWPLDTKGLILNRWRLRLVRGKI